MGTNRSRAQSPEVPSTLVRCLVWAVWRDALKRAEHDPQLRERLRVAVLRYVFIRALGGGTGLGRMAGLPEPGIDLPDLRRSPQLDVSAVTLALEYQVAHQKAKRLWPIRRSDRARWARLLLKEFPSLQKRDLVGCDTAITTAFIAVARQYKKAPDTVKRLVRTLPRDWGSLVLGVARAWDGQSDTLRDLRNTLRDLSTSQWLASLRKAPLGDIRPRQT